LSCGVIHGLESEWPSTVALRRRGIVRAATAKFNTRKKSAAGALQSLSRCAGASPIAQHDRGYGACRSEDPRDDIHLPVRFVRNEPTEAPSAERLPCVITAADTRVLDVGRCPGMASGDQNRPAVTGPAGVQNEPKWPNYTRRFAAGGTIMAAMIMAARVVG